MEFPDTPPTHYTHAVMRCWKQKHPEATAEEYNREFREVHRTASIRYERDPETLVLPGEEIHATALEIEKIFGKSGEDIVRKHQQAKQAVRDHHTNLLRRRWQKVRAPRGVKGPRHTPPKKKR